MVARSVLMPVQIWTWPIWWQFVGDTLPEMIFASAWCLLVTFFVQLVGVATGAGTNTSPGIVIQATVRDHAFRMPVEKESHYSYLVCSVFWCVSYSCLSMSMCAGLRRVPWTHHYATRRHDCFRPDLRLALCHLRGPLWNCDLLLSAATHAAAAQFRASRWFGVASGHLYRVDHLFVCGAHG